MQKIKIDGKLISMNYAAVRMREWSSDMADFAQQQDAASVAAIQHRIIQFAKNIIKNAQIK